MNASSPSVHAILDTLYVGQECFVRISDPHAIEHATELLGSSSGSGRAPQGQVVVMQQATVVSIAVKQATLLISKSNPSSPSNELLQTVNIDAIYPLDRAAFIAEDSQAVDRVEIDRLVMAPLKQGVSVNKSNLNGNSNNRNVHSGDELDSLLHTRYFVVARVDSIQYNNSVCEVSLSVPVFDSFVAITNESDFMQEVRGYLPYEVAIAPLRLSGSYGAGEIDASWPSAFLANFPSVYPIPLGDLQLSLQDGDDYKLSSQNRNISHVLNYSDAVSRLLQLEQRLEECFNMFHSMNGKLIVLIKRFSEILLSDLKVTSESINSGDIIDDDNNVFYVGLSKSINPSVVEERVANQIYRCFRGISRIVFLTVDLYRRYNTRNIITSDSNKALFGIHKQLMSRQSEMVHILVVELCENMRIINNSLPPTVALKARVVSIALYVESASLYSSCLCSEALRADKASVPLVDESESVGSGGLALSLFSRARDACDLIVESFENQLATTVVLDVEKQQWDSTSYYRRDCFVSTGLVAASIHLRRHMYYLSIWFKSAMPADSSDDIDNNYVNKINSIKKEFGILLVESYMRKLFEVYSAIEVSRIRHSQFVIDLLHILTTAIITLEDFAANCLGGFDEGLAEIREWELLLAQFLHYICLLFMRSITNADLLISALLVGIRVVQIKENSDQSSPSATSTYKSLSLGDIKRMLNFEDYFRRYFDGFSASSSVPEGSKTQMFYNSLLDHQLLGGKFVVTMADPNDPTAAEPSPMSLIDLFKKFPSFWTTQFLPRNAESALSSPRAPRGSIINKKSSGKQPTVYQASDIFRLVVAIDCSQQKEVINYFIYQIQKRPEFIGISNYQSSIASSGHSNVGDRADAEYLPGKSIFSTDKYDFPKLDDAGLEARQKLEALVELNFNEDDWFEKLYN